MVSAISRIREAAALGIRTSVRVVVGVSYYYISFCSYVCGVVMDDEAIRQSALVSWLLLLLCVCGLEGEREAVEAFCCIWSSHLYSQKKLHYTPTCVSTHLCRKNFNVTFKIAWVPHATIDNCMLRVLSIVAECTIKLRLLLLLLLQTLMLAEYPFTELLAEKKANDAAIKEVYIIVSIYSDFLPNMH